MEARVGFEPTNVGFANRCLRPLGYRALVSLLFCHSLVISAKSLLCLAVGARQVDELAT